jgi:hypothetical protein
MSVSKEVLKVVAEMPGVEANDIVELMPNVNASTVKSALTFLAQKGKVDREPTLIKTKLGTRKSFSYRLPAKANGHANGTAHAVPAPSPQAPPPRKQLASLKGQLAAAEEELARLRQWKAEALERFPELRVKPEVLEARKIVSGLASDSGDKDLAERVMRGECDNKLTIRAVVEALEKVA